MMSDSNVRRKNHEKWEQLKLCFTCFFLIVNFFSAIDLFPRNFCILAERPCCLEVIKFWDSS